MDPEDEGSTQAPGALSTVAPEEQSMALPAGTLASLKQSTSAAYDEYGRKIREARQMAVPSDLQRLSQAFLAAAKPNRWGSGWVGLQQGLESWQGSGAKIREQQAQTAAQDAELELKKKLAGSDLELRYLTKTAPKAPKLAKLVTQYNTTDGKMYSFNPYTGARVPDGMVVLEGGQTVPFSSLQDLSQVTPDQVAGGAAAMGAAPGAPAAGGMPPPPPPPPGEGAPAGEKWRQYVGQVGVPGEALGLNPDAIYNVTTTGATPIPGLQVVSGDEALRRSGGTYIRGQFETSTGEFKPFANEKPLPTPEEYLSNLNSLQSGLVSETAKLNQIRRLYSRFNGLTTGAAGSVLKFLPGSEPFSVAEELKTTVGNLAMAKLAELKQQSTTGASGLGSVTERELAMLERSIAALNQSMKLEDVQANAKLVIQHYTNVLESMKRDGQQVMSMYRRVKSITQPTSGKAPSEMTDDEVLEALNATRRR
jgi:hypothetical protein